MSSPSTSRITWLPASPVEGWASMDRYWRELDRVVRESPPAGMQIDCALPFPPPERSITAPRLKRMWDKYVVYPARARRVRAPLAHVLDHSYAHLLPHVPRRVKKVVTVFDLVPLEDPGHMNEAQIARFRRTVRKLRLADHLISISAETKKKLGQFLGIAPEKVTVAVPGTDFETFQKPVSEANPVLKRLRNAPPAIFSVGSAIPRKNLRSLPGIFAHLGDRFAEERVCFVRAGEKLPESLRSQIVSITGESGFIELGPLFGEDLVAAFQTARALIFPSTLEGLTFVIPEAMAAGCPAVTNTLTANPEAGGDVALYYEEGDNAAAAAHLITLLENETVHAERRAAGIARARRLTWKDHFDIVLDVYRQQLRLS